MSELEGERAREWSGVESERMISHFMFFSLPLRCPLGCRERETSPLDQYGERNLHTQKKRNTKNRICGKETGHTRGRARRGGLSSSGNRSSSQAAASSSKGKQGGPMPSLGGGTCYNPEQLARGLAFRAGKFGRQSSDSLAHAVA